MGGMQLNLRPVHRRAFYVLVSLVAVIAQFGWLGLGAASAAGSSLTYIDSNNLQKLTGYPSSISSVSVRSGSLAVVGSDGKVYIASGVVPNLTNVVKAYYASDPAITRGAGIGFAIKSDGTLWSWGNMQQLGRIHNEVVDGVAVQADDPNPGQITGLPLISDIEIGAQHVLALDVNGNVWSWGGNGQDQLGTNNSCQSSSWPDDTNGCSSATRYLPEQVTGLSNVKSISAGWSSSVAVTQSGSMMFWGTVCNIETHYAYYPVPSPYPGVGNDVKQALTDSCSVTYLTNSGSVYTWGYAGALPSSPTLVSSLQNIKSIATDGGGSIGYSNRIARDVSGIAYRYDASVNAPHYANPVYKIGNIGTNSDYYSYNTDYSASSQGGVLVVDYVAPYANEAIYLNAWTSSGSTFESILPDGTHLSPQNSQTQERISPDGSKVVYYKDCDLYTSNLDGTNEVNVTNSSANYCAGYPTWSPNGDKIVYTSWAQDGSSTSINTMNANGSNMSTVVNGQGVTGDPVSWSPDGTKLIFDYYIDNGLNIGTVNTDGSNIQYYPNIGNNDWSRPAWSPDGTRIAFLSQSRDPNASSYPYSIMVMNVDGSQSTTLYTSIENTYVQDLAWSPDSQQIAFVKYAYNPSTQNSNTYLDSVPAVGGAITQIVDMSPNGLDTIQWWHKSATTHTIAAPANLSIPSPTKTPSLTWSAVSGATSYKIYRDGSVIGTSTTLTYTDSTATQGSHSYYVTASDGTIESSASNSVSVTVDKTRPTMSFVTPSSFTGPFTTGPTVTVTGSDASGLSILAIHVYTSSNQLLTTCGSAKPADLAAGSMSCSLASLPDGTYYIKAGSFDNAGNNMTILSGNFTIHHL